MSLLDRGNEIVTIYPEVQTVSKDGNTVSRPSDTGVTARVSIQPISPGSPNDTDEQGVAAGSALYRLRPLRGQHTALGKATQIEWNSKRYALVGDPIRYNGSSRTAHVEYRIMAL